MSLVLPILAAVAHNSMMLMMKLKEDREDRDETSETMNSGNDIEDVDLVNDDLRAEVGNGAGALGFH